MGMGDGALLDLSASWLHALDVGRRDDRVGCTFGRMHRRMHFGWVALAAQTLTGYVYRMLVLL